METKPRRAGSGCPLGRAKALDDAVIGDAVRSKMPARQVDVFGSDTHAPVMARMEGCGHILDVGHGPDIDPGLGHGHDDIGVAKPQRGEHDDLLVTVGHRFGNQVLARHAQMHTATRQFARDLGRRQKRHLDPVDPLDLAAIITRATRLAQRHARAGEKGEGIVLQAAF